MSKPHFQYWWQCIPALPADRTEQAYHALRRVWGDHTIAGNRSFYRGGTEDHITPALFQSFSIFGELRWVNSLVEAIGGTVGNVTRVRWAYACEELLDAKLQPRHKRNFIIPDIVMMFEDEDGPGLVAFEVKKPGAATTAADGVKLSTYTDLPSMRSIERRYGCLLVNDQVAEKSRAATDSVWPVFSWEQLGRLQLNTVDDLVVSSTDKDRIRNWLARHLFRSGISVAEPTDIPLPFGDELGSAPSYRRIDELELPGRVARFLKGSECVEASWAGATPDAPMTWLLEEPDVDKIGQNKFQKTEDRRVCRWTFEWTPARERYWRVD